MQSATGPTAPRGKFLARVCDQAHTLKAMPNVQPEQDHLARADQGLGDAEGRVTKQLLLIWKFAEKGRDTALAENVLRSLERSLKVWRAHRQLILNEIARF